MARNTNALKIAKTLRKRMTDAEILLWQELRGNKLGVKFRRQMPFVFGEYQYVADFYCPALKLLVEIDGDVHNDQEIILSDKFREDFFRQSGCEVIRFKNDEVLKDIGNVIAKITDNVKKIKCQITV